MEYRDHQTALDVGNAIGELLAIDWKDRNRGWTGFLRLKIKINISNPLCRIVKLVGRDGIEIIRVLKYERLPAFCYSCGLIGHTTKKGKNKYGASKSNVLNLQHGSWMRVNIPNQDKAYGKMELK